MRIALDWDSTYTLAPGFWDSFISRAKVEGHDVRIVTFRTEAMNDAALTWMSSIIPVIFTAGYQKRSFCANLGWFPDIWIDDSPEFIVDRDDAALIIDDQTFERVNK